MAVLRTLKVDIYRRTVIERIPVVQGEVGSRYIMLQIYNNGVRAPIDGEIFVARANFRRSDGKADYKYCTIRNDTVEIPVGGFPIETDGITYCDVAIVENEHTNVSITDTFILDVGKSVWSPGDMQHEPQFVGLLEATDNAEKAAANANNAADGANKAAGNAQNVAEDLEARRQAGEFNGATGKDGPQGPQGPAGPKGDPGPQGPRGDSGVTVPASGFFTFAGDENGDLWCYYTGDQAPVFEQDENGDIYMTIGE